MTDAEKCRLIIDFEGRDPENEYGVDYPRDLNATMRAARKLTLHGREQIGICLQGALVLGNDPARVCFEWLAAYLIERKKEG